MNISLRIADRLPLALIYFVTASLSAELTRFDGSVAFLWVASAFLIADLMRRPANEWLSSIAPCVLASCLATGLFGLGWHFALPLALCRIIEAFIGAWLLRRFGGDDKPLGSVSWLLKFTFFAGFVGPLIGGVLAGVTLSFGEMAGVADGFHFFAAHSLGNLMVTPLALLVAQRSRRATLAYLTRAKVIEGILLFGTVIVTSVLVFSQNVLPLPFMPILPAILTTFRLGRGAAAAAVVVIALIGGAATIAGFGPVHLIDGWIGTCTQFFQLYLAATVLTVLPVAADLEYRSRLHRTVKLSDERFRLFADHSTDILLHLELDGRIRYVSPSMSRLGGHDPGALVGRNSLILVAPGHVDAIKAAYMRVVGSAGETHRYEYLALIADGSQRWFETHSRALIDDQGKVESSSASRAKIRSARRSSNGLPPTR